MKPWEITDLNGDKLRIYASADFGADAIPGAIVDTDPGGTLIRPDQVPAAARALYQAAGLPVPDLPGTCAQPAADGDLMTPAEVATAFRVDLKTVTKWARGGKLASIRTPGGHRRYDGGQVRALLACAGRP